MTALILLTSCGECSHPVMSDWTVTREPTCVLEGEKSAKCGDCGQILTQTIAKKKHVFGNYVPNDDSTCNFIGTATAKCENCPAKETKLQDGNPYGHTYFDGVCSLCSDKMELIDSFDASMTDQDTVTVKIYKGTDGHYELDVTGSGNMRDYTAEDAAPWNKYSSYITTIHFYEGVESIGDMAFYELSLAKFLYVEKGLKSFGKDVFGKGYYPAITHVFDMPTWVSFDFEDEGVPAIYNTTLMYVGEVIKGEDGSRKVEKRSTTVGDLILPEGVESINPYSFYNCAHMMSITLPDSIKKIGDYAFYGTSRLGEVHVGLLDTWLGIEFGKNHANPLSFAGNLWIADELTREIVIPANITKLNEGVFNGCTSIMKLKIEGELTEIPSYAFYECSKLESIEFGNSVKSIGAWAFYGCRSLKSVTLPDSVEAIGENAFADCIRLYSLDVGNGLCEIGETVFTGCRELVSVKLGKNVTKIAQNAFLGSKKIIEVCNLSSLDISGLNFLNNAVYVYGEGEGSRISILTEGDASGLVFYRDGIGTYLVGYAGETTKLKLSREILGEDFAVYKMAFYRSYIKELIIGEGVTSFHKDAFLDCSISSVSVPSVLVWCNISFESETANPFYVAEKLFVEGGEKEITEITIPTEVTAIPAYAFAGLGQIKTFALHDGIKSIGKGAFLGCLRAFTETNNVSYIGKWAVEVDKTKSNATFKSDTVGFADGIFDGTNLTDITLDAGVLPILPKDTVKSLTISGGKIASGAFKEFTALESVSLSSSISKDSISEGAFDGCIATSVTASVAHLPSLRGEVVTSLTINGGSVKRTDVTHFTSLKSLTIVAGVNGIEKGCFKDFTTLESLAVRGGIYTIPDNAFEGCISLRNVSLHRDITTIGTDAFFRCALAMKYEHGGYYIDNWLISVIGGEDYAIILAETVGIANGALPASSPVRTIYFMERSAYWTVIRKNTSANSAIDNCAIYYYREIEPYTEGDFWHFVDGKPTPWPPYVKA